MGSLILETLEVVIGPECYIRPFALESRGRLLTSRTEMESVNTASLPVDNSIGWSDLLRINSVAAHRFAVRGLPGVDQGFS